MGPCNGPQREVFGASLSLCVSLSLLASLSVRGCPQCLCVFNAKNGCGWPHTCAHRCALLAHRLPPSIHWPACVPRPRARCYRDSPSVHTHRCVRLETEHPCVCANSCRVNLHESSRFWRRKSSVIVLWPQFAFGFSSSRFHCSILRSKCCFPAAAFS